MRARFFGPFALLLLLCGPGGCGSEDDEACDSSEAAGSCSGSFTCSNGGLTFSCDRATQACVLRPGSVNCVTVGSAGSCPTKSAARQAAGCTSGAETTCSGSSASGIVVECSY